MADPLDVYEKMGSFYLGKGYDLRAGKLRDDLLLYDSKDLVTHAVLVGMTGSGKTGLGVALLEEAAIDNIPALVIDPKGDLANLLLTFPDLKPEDFRPWINTDDCARHGVSPDEFAASEAEKWKSGLASWRQGGDRIGRLRDAAEFTVYTPGSDAGVPISILSSFAAPPKEMLDDGDLMRDRVSTTATSILSLLGIDADPVRSREHILLTTILDHCWRNGQSLDLGAIIRLVQMPPVNKVGVMDLDAFFPAKDRFELAMTLNNLLAAPSFAAWMSGESMDVDRLLYTPEGKPRVSIFSIAHLSETERMFFVSLLLNQTIGWMRSRPGTSTLRALLYIDEIFGYMPPVAEPPSKKPLLTLLKQARAYGLGLVLATQNPVDLDYKGLSNTGTWFIGRLQTDRDKQRVLDGLEGATAETGEVFNRSQMSEILSGVGKRVFLMHNVHEDAPTVFHSRWALSYLAGPMTRMQIKRLMVDREPEITDPVEAEALPEVHEQPAVAAIVPPEQPVAPEPSRPVLPAEIRQYFLPIQRLPGNTEIVYRPYLVGLARVHFVDTRRGLAADEELTAVTPLNDRLRGVDWSEMREVALLPDDFSRDPEPDIPLADLPRDAAVAKSYTGWKKDLEDHLYRARRHPLYKSKLLGEYSQPGESERDFRIRLTEQAHEQRDLAMETLRGKYATRLQRLENSIASAEQKVEVERSQAEAAQTNNMISWGATVLSALMGRKITSGTVGRATTAARGIERTRKQAGDVQRALDKLVRYEDQLSELEHELEQEEAMLHDKYNPLIEELDSVMLKPRKSDIDVRLVALGWAPCVKTAKGWTPLFD